MILVMMGDGLNIGDDRYRMHIGVVSRIISWGDMSPSCEITWCTCGCKWLMVMFVFDGLLCHVMINYVNW